MGCLVCVVSLYDRHLHSRSRPYKPPLGFRPYILFTFVITVYQEVENRISKFRNMLFDKLMELPSSVDEQKKLIRFLIHVCQRLKDSNFSCSIFWWIISILITLWYFYGMMLPDRSCMIYTLVSTAVSCCAAGIWLTSRRLEIRPGNAWSTCRSG